MKSIVNSPHNQEQLGTDLKCGVTETDLELMPFQLPEELTKRFKVMRTMIDYEEEGNQYVFYHRLPVLKSELAKIGKRISKRMK